MYELGPHASSPTSVSDLLSPATTTFASSFNFPKTARGQTGFGFLLFTRFKNVRQSMHQPFTCSSVARVCLCQQYSIVESMCVRLSCVHTHRLQPADATHELCWKLSRLLRDVLPTDVVVVAGDVNAQIYGLTETVRRTRGQLFGFS